MTGCFINRALFKTISVAPILAFLLICSCAANQASAKAAIERAKHQQRVMEAQNVPAERTLNFRIKLKNAETALQGRSYRKAVREAAAAEKIAVTLLHERELMGNELRFRLDKLRIYLEAQAKPPQSLVDGYFDAFEAFQNNEYELSAELIAQLETTAVRGTNLGQTSQVAIQAEQWYYDLMKTIPVYSSITDDGQTGQPVAQLKYPASARFLGAKYIARDYIYYHVFVDDDRYRVEGWVEKRFVY